MKKSFCALAALMMVAVMADVSKMKPIFTVPHELDCLLKSGHIQGACCSEQGIYLSHQLGIDKIGWDGKLIKHVEAPAHLGDSAYADGKIYGAFVIRDKKNRKNVALREQLQARARLLQLELENVDPNSPEYQRLLKIIANYQKQIDRLNQEIAKYEEES